MRSSRAISSRLTRGHERLPSQDVNNKSSRTHLSAVRGRIEILMDEIDISLGIEPAPIPGLADLEADPAGEDPVIAEGQQIDD